MSRIGINYYDMTGQNNSILRAREAMKTADKESVEVGAAIVTLSAHPTY